MGVGVVCMVFTYGGAHRCVGVGRRLCLCAALSAGEEGGLSSPHAGQLVHCAAVGVSETAAFSTLQPRPLQRAEEAIPLVWLPMSHPGPHLPRQASLQPAARGNMGHSQRQEISAQHDP